MAPSGSPMAAVADAKCCVASARSNSEVYRIDGFLALSQGNDTSPSSFTSIRSSHFRRACRARPLWFGRSYKSSKAYNCSNSKDTTSGAWRPNSVIAGSTQISNDVQHCLCSSREDTKLRYAQAFMQI